VVPFSWAVWRLADPSGGGRLTERGWRAAAAQAAVGEPHAAGGGGAGGRAVAGAAGPWPVWVANELRPRGHSPSLAGMRGVWQRHHLETMRIRGADLPAEDMTTFADEDKEPADERDRPQARAGRVLQGGVSQEGLSGC
jgi:hypothetical protein